MVRGERGKGDGGGGEGSKVCRRGGGGFTFLYKLLCTRHYLKKYKKIVYDQLRKGAFPFVF